jgi:hypothetical protein
MRTEEAKKVEVDEANLSKVASLVLKSEDDAVLASLTEVVGDLARIGTPPYSSQLPRSAVWSS